jgi:hypothetical protein
MIKPYNLQRLFPLCYLRCLLFGSQRLTEANEGNEEEILAPKNFVLRPFFPSSPFVVLFLSFSL